MKIIYRYLTMLLLMPLAMCCITFLFLWLIFDLFDTLNDLIRFKPDFGLVVQFYAYQLPSTAQVVLPIAFLFSSLFCLSNLSYNREIIALQSLNVSIFRISIPMFVVAGLITLSQYLLYMHLSPTGHSNRVAIEQKIKGESKVGRLFHTIVHRDPKTGNMWYVKELDLTEGTFKHAEILVVSELSADAVDKMKIFAAQGKFVEGLNYWDLAKVRIVKYNIDGSAQKPEDISQLDAKFLNVPPNELIAQVRPPNEMGWGELLDFIRNPPEMLSERALAPYFTEHHYRMAYPLMNIVLAFYAIALGVGHSRRNIAGSVFNCIFVLFALLVTLNLSLALGRGGKISPFWAGWFPIVFFGVIGLAVYVHKAGWTWNVIRLFENPNPPPDMAAPQSA